ncbi:IclR family transcriptional regulator [Thermopolyspora sp. NPDC052614]|uniref:IclR family transcriptional regulator n=1 Tax=Thermopolyspora sp. NPDC052614 TaxID=3155682 RepID=UPI003441B6FD
MKTPPRYSVTSVDHALRLATMLQLEGSLTISQAAQRLRVAPSTAHRLLAMLVYRDFATQDDQHIYHAGPVLELAAHSKSSTARLRAAAMPHLSRVVAELDETSSISIRTGQTTRFLATVECGQSLRVTSREGMVFPAHRTTTGMLYLAGLEREALARFFDSGWYADNRADIPDPGRLRTDLARVRRNGFALNEGRSERGLVALGVPVRDTGGELLAGLSVSLPSARYDRQRLPDMVATLHAAAQALQADLAHG